MAEEIEIKLTGQDETVLRSVFSSPFIKPFMEHEPVVMPLMAYYLDTPDFALAGAGYALRIRKEGDQWKAAVKRRRGYSKGLYVRDEWEVDIPRPMVDFEIFSEPDLVKTLSPLVKREPLVVLFEVSVNRTGAPLVFADGTCVDMVVDEGEIRSYGFKEPVSELEMELKAGSRERLVGIGEALKERYSLKEGEKSKYVRGMGLLHKAHPTKFSGAVSFFASFNGKSFPAI